MSLKYGKNPPHFACLFRPHRLAWPRTLPFQGSNTGSNPVGDTTFGGTTFTGEQLAVRPVPTESIASLVSLSKRRTIQLRDKCSDHLSGLGDMPSQQPADIRDSPLGLFTELLPV